MRCFILKCKICNKDLYKNITWKSVFSLNYEVHEECLRKLVFNQDEVIIPIDLNTIIYDYVFEELKSDLNVQYLEFTYLINIMIKHLNKRVWSMMILYDEKTKYFLQNYNPYLLLNLTNKPILIISLVESNLSEIEQL